MQPIYDFISQFIFILYQSTGNLGLALIAITALIRTAMIPLTNASLKITHQMKELQPELKKLQDKHGKDKTALQAAQLDLYKRYNVNPLAGCLPQIVQIAVLILLYQVLIQFLNKPEINGVVIDPTFLGLNLSQKDPTRILPILAGVTQLVLSFMIAPGAEQADVVPNDAKTKKIKKANEKEENFAEMAASMQQQMLFIMPVMTGFIALNFPAGLSLYWVLTTVFSIGQQWYISGPGGLKTYYQRAVSFISRYMKGSK